jgi:hypothetical protein
MAWTPSPEVKADGVYAFPREEKAERRIAL